MTTCAYTTCEDAVDDDLCCRLTPSPCSSSGSGCRRTRRTGSPHSTVAL